MSTIFAQATPYGKSGIAVFRVSGPNSLCIGTLLSRKSELHPRYMYATKIYDPQTHKTIDQVMITYFKAPHSFTGEDSIEIHTHGSIAISRILTETILSTDLARIAEPGEFSKRAFLNGKIGLIEAEGLIDLIEAETKMQHHQAIQQMTGSLETLYFSWKIKLLNTLALIEAHIDFPEEDIPHYILSSIENSINDIKAQLHIHLSDNNSGEKLRHGITLSIIGPVNVGKSTLMNFLNSKEISIVSNIPGTTRDIVSSYIDIGGYPIILADTAGIRNTTNDLIEQEGIRRAIKQAKNSDIKIMMLDHFSFPLSEEILDLIDNNTIPVINKIDINDPNIDNVSGISVIKISLKTQTDLEKVFEQIKQKASDIANPVGNTYITRARYRKQLSLAYNTLAKCDITQDIAIAAEDIRIATRHLNILIGKIDVEEILGEVFANFCIGK